MNKKLNKKISKQGQFANSQGKKFEHKIYSMLRFMLNDRNVSSVSGADFAGLTLRDDFADLLQHTTYLVSQSYYTKTTETEGRVDFTVYDKDFSMVVECVYQDVDGSKDIRAYGDVYKMITVHNEDYRIIVYGGDHADKNCNDAILILTDMCKRLLKKDREQEQFIHIVPADILPQMLDDITEFYT